MAESGPQKADSSPDSKIDAFATVVIVSVVVAGVSLWLAGMPG